MEGKKKEEGKRRRIMTSLMATMSALACKPACTCTLFAPISGKPVDADYYNVLNVFHNSTEIWAKY